MENFVVSARKYRPADFKSVVGQQHITTTLQNAIKNKHLAQAFLFCGPRGVGKTTCARILAKTINCESITKEFEACGTCDACVSFKNNASFNVYELDAASNNSVDDIRNLVEQVRYAPQKGEYKVYIIDEVHMLSTAAFNAFLKTLEEPPKYAIFILATTEKHKIIPTILSRCQIFDFNRIQIKHIAEHLKYIAGMEEVDYEEEALRLIATKADGALRDALSIFDLIVTYSAGKKVTYQETIANLNILDYDYYFKVVEALLEENISTTLLLFDEILKKGFDGHNFIVGLSEHLRDLLVVKDEATVELLQVSESVKGRYLEQTSKASVSFLLSALNLANQCDIHYKTSKNQRLHVELTLMKVAKLNQAFRLATLAEVDAKKKSLIEGPTSTDTPPLISKSVETDKPLVNPSIGPGPSPVSSPVVSSTLRSTFTIPSSFSQTKKVGEAKVEEANLVEEEFKKDPIETVSESVPALVLTQELLDQSIFSIQEVYRTAQKNLELAILDQKIKVQEGELILKVNGSIQEDIALKMKPELVSLVRKFTGTSTFTITVIQQEEAPNENGKLYTSTDKLKFLREKHPALVELQRKFDLDVDF